MDQIELIIYSKTNKYPDRYLHYLSNLNNSDIEVMNSISKVSAFRSFISKTRRIIEEKMISIRKLQLRKTRI